MYLSTKVKQEVKEVNSARTRLDATLQSLVDKKEDSAESTAESEDDDGPVMISVPVVRSSGSPAASPSKRGLLVRARKRKRKLESIDATDAGAKYHQTSYVMKLFDRSVDLAQFNDKTPLYPIARAWINNNSVVEEDDESKSDEPKDDQKDPNCLYKMPLPLRLKIETGPSGDPRIPPPIITNDEPLDIHKDPDLGPAPEELLLKHMARWKNIRRSWINAARINELRYNNSMIILKDMFEQNLQEQTQSSQ